MQSKSLNLRIPIRIIKRIQNGIPVFFERNTYVENNKNMETVSNLASDKPLHGQELIDAIRALGIKKPIAHVHKALEKKGLCICYTSVYLAIHGDIFNQPTFEYLSSLGIKHNRSAKKKGRPLGRDRKQNMRS